MKAPQAIGWWIKDRSVSDPSYTFSEIQYPTEEAARAKFDGLRAHAEEHGGSAVLIHDGQAVASFSHWAKNE